MRPSHTTRTLLGARRAAQHVCDARGAHEEILLRVVPPLGYLLLAPGVRTLDPER